MARRHTQSALVLLLVIGLAAFLWGCGGSDQGSTTATSAVSNPTRTTAAPSVSSAVDEVLYKELAVTDDTPEDVVAAIGQARPVVMLFYVPGNVDDAKVLEAFQAVEPEFPEYTFLTYDYKNPQEYGDLSMVLQVNYPPEIVLIDRAGTVQRIWNGYVDEGTLKQCLINLGES